MKAVFRSERVLNFATRSAAILSASIVLLVIGFLVREAFPALRNPGPTSFLTDPSWHPLSGRFNITPMIVATLLTSVGAIAIAAPLGIASAIFIHFYSSVSIANAYRRLLEILAGIPSVVFGLWGLVVLAPVIAGFGGSGQNLLTATIVLSLMVLPTVALLSDSSLASVPSDWIQAASAVGLQRWATVSRVVLPSAKKGIASGVMLALTRALGETMAVLMLAGNIVEMPDSLLSPGRTLNANIALELGYASASHRSVLFVCGLALMLVVSVLVISVSRSRRQA